MLYPQLTDYKDITPTILQRIRVKMIVAAGKINESKGKLPANLSHCS